MRRYGMAGLVLGVVSVALAADSYSWEKEKDLQGWEGTNGGKVEVVTAESGAPAGAITDGKSCLKITQKDGKWRQVAWNIEEANESIAKNDTIDMDVFLPAEAVPVDDGYCFMCVGIQGDGGWRIEKQLDFDTKSDEAKKGKSYHLTWKYGGDPKFKKDAGWLQLFIKTQCESGTKMSPIYLDKVVFSTATK